jgi:anti-sigma B factor antagonist
VTLEERTAPDGATVIHVSGDVDLGTHLALEAAIVRAVRNGGGPVVVDLAAVPFLDSSGVRALLKGREEALSHHTAVSVRNAQGVVQTVLRVTQVGPLLGLTAS